MRRLLLLLGLIWLRGLRQLSKHAVEVSRLSGVGQVLAWVIVVAPFAIAEWLSRSGWLDVASLSPWAICTLMAGYYLGLAPLLLYFRLPPTAAESAEAIRFVPLRTRLDHLEADLDRVAAKLGIRWREHWMAQVDALRQAGELGKAAGVYRQEAGVSWAHAHDAVRDWSKNAAERKVRAILLAVKAPLTGDAEASVVLSTERGPSCILAGGQGAEHST